MKALADYVHSKGLKIGIYSSPGPKTCAGYEGSYGHEVQDAKTYAAWGIDYLKYDLCSASTVYKDDAPTLQAIYQEMGEALQATHRPIVYSLCQYGRAEVWTVGREERRQSVAHDRRHLAIAGSRWTASASASSSSRHTPSPGTGTIRTCWRSATAA